MIITLIIIAVLGTIIILIRSWSRKMWFRQAENAIGQCEFNNDLAKARSIVERFPDKKVIEYAELADELLFDDRFKLSEEEKKVTYFKQSIFNTERIIRGI